MEKRELERHGSVLMKQLFEKHLKDPITKECVKCGPYLEFKKDINGSEISAYLYKCKKCGAEYPKYTKKEWQELAMKGGR